MDEVPNADELINYFPTENRHSSTYSNFISFITDSHNTRELAVGNTILFDPDDDDFTPAELEEIEEKGYRLYWIRACQWYEVRLRKYYYE